MGPDAAPAGTGGRDSEASVRRESDLEDPNKIVPCYGEVWVQKRNRLREKTSFADAVGACDACNATRRMDGVWVGVWVDERRGG